MEQICGLTTITPVYPVSSVTYWESPEIRKLYGTSAADHNL